MVIFLTGNSSLFSICLHVMSTNTVLGITFTPIKDPGIPAIILILFYIFRNTNTIYYFIYLLVLVQIQSVEHGQHSH